MRVVIGEDQALMRAGLTLVLEQAGFEIVAVAGDNAIPREDLPKEVVQRGMGTGEGAGLGIQQVGWRRG